MLWMWERWEILRESVPVTEIVVVIEEVGEGGIQRLRMAYSLFVCRSHQCYVVS